jgi:hypothetical protein
VVATKERKCKLAKKINCLVIVEKKNEQPKESVNNQEKNSLKKICKECMYEL